MNKKAWIVYKHTSITSNKSYIGMTYLKMASRFSRHVIDSKRKSQHHFHRAIRKYGQDDFEHTILGIFANKEIAFKGEIYFIEKYDTFKNGYNMTKGGDSGPICKGELNGMYGKTHTDIVKKEMSRKKKLLVGDKHPHFGKISPLKGKTYEEVMGIEKAKELKERKSKKMLGTKRPDIKGDKNPAKLAENRIKISEGKCRAAPTIILDGKRYECIGKAMADTGLSYYKIKKLSKEINE